MKKVIFASAAAIGVSMLALGAVAKDPRGGDRGFAHMDVNGDGKVTADELNEKHEKLIAEADANGDGALTQEELKAFHEARREEWREKRNPDKNGDGVVDKYEFTAAAEARFDRMDKNGDGVLSEDEMPKRRGFGGRGGPDKD